MAVELAGLSWTMAMELAGLQQLVVVDCLTRRPDEDCVDFPE